MAVDIAVTAQGVVNERMARAQMFWTDYRLISWDEETGIAVIESPRIDAKTGKHPQYHVELATGGCDCPDSVSRIAGLNARLIAAGLPGGVACIHGCGIAQKLVNQFRSLLLVESQRQARDAAARVRTSAKTFAADWGN